MTAAQCRTCRALILMGNAEAHGEWHDRLRATLTQIKEA